MITPTTAFNKIATLKKPIRVIQGGTSAGKTFSILLYLIYYGLKKDLLISIVAESVPVLKRGAYKDFQDILISLDLYDEINHNKTDRTIKVGKSTFEFFSADDSSKLRGSRRDILFLNEGNNVTFEAFQELNVRTKQFTFLDYNPTAPFYAHTELIGGEGVDFLILNYKDNEFLNQKIINEIESWELKAETSEYYKNRWKVMGLGQLGIQSGAIYNDWTEIDSLPVNAELLASGLDWGYANDMTALVSLYRYNSELILDEKLYQKGMLNSQIAQHIKGTDAKNGIIYCDSAEPKSIAELKYYGLNVLPVIKGKDSINYGIQLVQEQPFRVTTQSLNIIKELQNYTWMKDKDGNSLNIPIDNFNDILDATRYIFLMKFSKRTTHFNLKWKH
jgi:phage terminase large subunit